MFFCVDLVDAWLASRGLHAETTWIDNVLLGLVAAALVLLLQRQQEIELRRQRHSAEIIEQMNHHIRNALQVIVARATLDHHAEPEVHQIQGAVARIDWALREILPGRVSTPAPPEPPLPELTDDEHPEVRRGSEHSA